MKNTFTTCLLGLFLLVSCFTSAGASAPGRDPEYCVEIDGMIENDLATKEDQCLVELISSNEVLQSVVLKSGRKKFKLYLKRNTNYTIRLSKKGCITRLISVDTKMSEGEFENYVFSFGTRLPEESEAEKMNKEFLELPIALIYYDAKKDSFVYDKEYTTRLKKEIVVK